MEKKNSFLYSVEQKAHLKILLHAARYSHAEINGILIGNINDHVVNIIDAIPLFHTPVLTPILETGFVLAEEYCKSDQTPENTSILGWYHGPAKANYDGVSKHVCRISNKINSKNTNFQSCLVVIQANELADEDKPGVKVLIQKDSNDLWVDAASVKFDSSVGAEYTKLLCDGKQRQLDDVDAWLENTATCDWRNLTLVK